MRPLILDFAIPMEKDISKENLYCYDNNLNLNVINTNNSTIPFVETGSKKVELSTRTDVKSESDDESINSFRLQTQTRIINEADDEENKFEMYTSTAVKKEEDDNSVFYDLQTQTFVNNETQDESLSPLLLSTLTKIQPEDDENDTYYN